MSEPTLHELNAHLRAYLLPAASAAQEAEPVPAPKRGKKSANVILGDGQLTDEPSADMIARPRPPGAAPDDTTE